MSDPLATPISDVLPETRYADPGTPVSQPTQEYIDVNSQEDTNRAVNSIRGEMPRFKSPKQVEYLDNNIYMRQSAYILNTVRDPIIVFIIIKILASSFVKSSIIKYVPWYLNNGDLTIWGGILELMLMLLAFFVMKKFIEKQFA